MSNVDKIRKILVALGVPEKQQNDLCCYVLLVMAKIYPKSKWENAQNEWVRIHDIIGLINNSYSQQDPYAENTREEIRKKAIHNFRTAVFVEDNVAYDKLATNSPNYRYRLTAEFLNVLKNKGSEESVKAFLKKHESLKSIYASKKDKQKLEVNVNGTNLKFSPGKHNQLQKAIIEKFKPYFAKDAECLYVGDGDNKNLVNEEEKLKKIGLVINTHDITPDVVLYDKQKNWLYIIEAVTSVGWINQERLGKLGDLTKNVKAGKIFVTAFLDFGTYKKFAADLAWDTEVWISDMPEHMIHLNGDKFLGPRV